MLRSLLRKQLTRLPAAWQNRVAMWREEIRGVDFTQVALDSLGLDAAHSVKYSPSDDLHLRELLDALTLRTTDRILDYSCGKGRALRTMSEYPFACADGVELSPALAATAPSQLHPPARAKQSCVHFRIRCRSVYSPRRLHPLLLVQSIPSVVVRAVIANIYASLERRARDITVICCNAVCLDDFVPDGRFKVVREAADVEGNRSVILSLPSRR